MYLSTNAKPKKQPVKISSFPQELREKAAKQFIYGALTENVQIEQSNKKAVYEIIQQFDIIPYIESAFIKKEENSIYLLALELSNVFTNNNINLYNIDYIVSIFN